MRLPRGGLRAIVVGTGLLAVAAGASAEIYRCKAAGGAVTYQEIPCDAASDARVLAIPAAFPEVNLAERERILQREAALEARQLKRAELDTAERIAREDRRAREAEAERDRLALAAALAAAGNPGLVTVVLARPARLIRQAPRHRRVAMQ